MGFSLWIAGPDPSPRDKVKLSIESLDHNQGKPHNVSGKGKHTQYGQPRPFAMSSVFTLVALALNASCFLAALCSNEVVGMFSWCCSGLRLESRSCWIRTVAVMIESASEN